MKSTASKLVLAALLGAGMVGWAQDDNGDTPAPDDAATKRTFGNGVLSENVAIYDIDDSGSLSVEELQALQADRLSQERHGSLRSRWDLNRDGRIDAREREEATRRIRQIIEERRCRRFDQVDRNSDGFLSLEEFLNISAVANTDSGTELFKHLDHDGDRQISKAEFLRSLDNLRSSPVGETPTPKPRDDTNTLDDPTRP